MCCCVMTQAIYLDYQATTPTDPRVLAVMLPYFSERFANPHSVEHALGRAVEAKVESARAEIARLIGAEAREVVFTSGATEANNMAILGAGRFRARAPKPRSHVVTLATEHKCVLECVRQLQREGLTVDILPVQPDGLVDLDLLARTVTENTALVSIMAANNEIGVLQPLAAIGALCRENGAWFHTDAAQAFGKVPLDVDALNIDLLSVSGHKVYGPKGIGALYVRRRPRVRLEPLFHGGGQERGLRSGTLPAPLCIGLGEAARIAGGDMAADAERLGALSDRLLQTIRQALPAVRVNGSREHRLPHNLNLTFPGVDAQELLKAVPDLALSTGSACSSAAVEPSYVLAALGLSEADARASVRLALGRPTTGAEVDRAAESLIAAARTLQQARPAAE
ncbi:MAG: aminotransferase class V-fold PLP-dependent enzyme [Alphaproteobacteria bacterium]|nr:aminotransferase class V-fold PLP-dependent enzyme [Alphaproteobacteria bacterium]MCB9931060.1 aminotransferase class V-fold PLP-dependent enzyme [Alphaproteobacteria bacterium]